jgi:hypothetical protein
MGILHERYGAILRSSVLHRMLPNNADGIPLTPTEQKILAEFVK